MLKELGKTTSLTGQSGQKYVFNLYSFDAYDDIKDAWKSVPALYLFTRRYVSNGAYYHTYIYLGETGDLSTRFLNHHKEDCIKQNSSNCIGIYTNVSTVEEERFAVEKDILLANSFPCNDQNN